MAYWINIIEETQSVMFNQFDPDRSDPPTHTAIVLQTITELEEAIRKSLDLCEERELAMLQHKVELAAAGQREDLIDINHVAFPQMTSAIREKLHGAGIQHVESLALLSLEDDKAFELKELSGITFERLRTWKRSAIEILEAG